MRLLTAILLVATTSACLEVNLPETTAVGFFTQSTHSDGGAGFVMAPEATFYGNVSLTVATPPVDSCFIAPIAPAGTGTTVYVTLDAGPVIFTRIGARDDSLRPVVTGGQVSYRPGAGIRIPFVPGDSIQITVPGAPVGFPTAMMKTRTSEVFTHDPIAVPATVAPINLTWTPAPQPGSSMIFSLRYANAQAAGEVNEQIYCGFVDDGSATIPANLTVGWVTSLDGRRASRATRFRSTTMLLESNRRFTYISTFTLPVPPIPVGF